MNLPIFLGECVMAVLITVLFCLVYVFCCLIRMPELPRFFVALSVSVYPVAMTVWRQGSSRVYVLVKETS